MKNATSHAKQIVPSGLVVKVTKGASDFTDGACRALWIGTPGTINITTHPAGDDLDDFPAKEGLMPVSCIKVRASGTADDIYALY